MKASYSAQLWRQSYLLTSVDLLGNPVGTLTQIAAGIGDLVTDPLISWIEQDKKKNNDWTVFDGIEKGAKSFWDNTVYGTFNAVSRISGAAAQVSEDVICG